MIEISSLFRSKGRSYKVEVEQFFKYVKRPFSLAKFDFDNLTGVLTLHWVRGEIADVAYSVNGFTKVGRQLSTVD